MFCLHLLSNFEIAHVRTWLAAPSETLSLFRVGLPVAPRDLTCIDRIAIELLADSRGEHEELLQSVVTFERVADNVAHTQNHRIMCMITELVDKP